MEYLTTRQVAEQIKRTPSRVVQLIREGRLPATKMGNVYLIDPKDLEGFTLPKITGRPRLEVSGGCDD